jgi:hypothetical protein
MAAVISAAVVFRISVSLVAYSLSLVKCGLAEQRQENGNAACQLG